MNLRKHLVLTLGAALLATGLVTGGAHAGTAPTATGPGGGIGVLDSCLVSPTHPTLARGSTGPAVYHAQCIMKQYANQNIAVDGIFGANTERAVKNVQSVFGLNPDGIVGPRTWGALHSLAP